MKTRSRLMARGVASLALAASVISVAAPVLSQGADPGKPSATQDAAEEKRMREPVHARLERLAQRLEIKASQQQAWNAYVGVAQSMADTKLTRPGAEADAATLLRSRSERSAEHAKKLAQLADATARLQQSLTPEQRKVLDEDARQWGRERGGRGQGYHRASWGDGGGARM